LRRGLANSWEMFWESRIGPIGLFIILFYGLLAVAHPILMLTVWDRAIYDPKHGYDRQIIYKGLDGRLQSEVAPGSDDYYVDTNRDRRPDMILAGRDGILQSVKAGDDTYRGGPAPPSLRHWLGTDPWGRDVFSQLAFSARAEFFLGVMAALITVVIGTLVAAISAYYGGFVDTFFMRLADVVILFPVIAFLIVLGSLFQLNLYSLALVLGIIGGFGGITIVLKSQALSIKVRPFIEAARIAGGGHFHIIVRHIIPNLLPLSFLYMMFNVTSAIFSEAVLSFFGIINIDMSWGIMVQMANIAGYLQGGAITKAWWIFFPASVSITALCAAFYFVGRGLDEIVNPRLRKI
jgi:peptide/nickel transport system permease protein